MQTSRLFAGIFLTALFLLPALCPAQTVSIVSGNGQLVCEACAGGPYPFAPLVVQVDDSTGAAVAANTPVSWTLTQPGVQPVVVSSVTNASGQATYTPSKLVSPFFAELSDTVVAEALGASAKFVETVSAPGGGGGPAVIPALVTGPLPALSGAEGTPSSTAITVSVFSQSGPVAGISIALATGKTGPSVSCAQTGPLMGAEPGIILTGANGTATCTPQFGMLGTGTYTLVVGGDYVIFGPASLTVTSGPPEIIKVIGTNPQFVSPGIKTSLTAEVTDIAGNASDNVAVTFKVTAGTATLTSATGTTGTNGEVTDFVTPTIGPVTVTVALASNSAVQNFFTINVNQAITGLQILSGNGQQAAENAAFADPLVVQVNDNTVAVPGAPVTFAVASGSATLSAAPGSAETNCTVTGTSCIVTAGTNGQAQVDVTAGANYGTVTVNASAAYAGATYNQPFTLTVNPPGPIISSVVNAAGYAQAPTASPCSLVTIYGTGLATGLQGVVQPFIAPQYQVAGVTVQFGNPPVSAPILYVANVNGQESMSVQVPCQVGLGTAVPMVVTAGNTPSQPFNVNVMQYSPGIFQFTDFSDGTTNGTVRAVLVRSDGTLISAANAARPGDILRMFVTGIGQTTPNLFTDEFDPLVLDSSNNWVPQVLTVNAQLAVGVANNGVLIVSQTYSDDMVGVYEVAFQVPTTASPGNNIPFAIGVYIDDATKLMFGNPSVIPIQ